MWGTLQHPRHVEFYEEFHANRQSGEEDWMPMVKAVRHLQSLAVAPSLYAFTSLWRFHATTAPAYLECDGHCSVTIVWRYSDRRFHLALDRLDEGWLEDRTPECICAEEEFPLAITPFIERLLASKAPFPPGPSQKK